MTDNSNFLMFFILFQAFTISLMLLSLYKRWKKKQPQRMRQKFKVIEGEKVERKIRN